VTTATATKEPAILEDGRSSVMQRPNPFPDGKVTLPRRLSDNHKFQLDQSTHSPPRRDDLSVAV